MIDQFREGKEGKLKLGLKEGEKKKIKKDNKFTLKSSRVIKIT